MFKLCQPILVFGDRKIHMEKILLMTNRIRFPKSPLVLIGLKDNTKYLKEPQIVQGHRYLALNTHS